MRNYYLNLYDQYTYFLENKQTRFAHVLRDYMHSIGVCAESQRHFK